MEGSGDEGPQLREGAEELGTKMACSGRDGGLRTSVLDERGLEERERRGRKRRTS